jgi:hypothetical protein
LELAQHFGTGRIETTGPEFLNLHRISVKHSIPVGSQTPSPEISERAQHFGRIERTGPEFLDHHRISALRETPIPEFLPNMSSSPDLHVFTMIQTVGCINPRHTYFFFFVFSIQPAIIHFIS